MTRRGFLAALAAVPAAKPIAAAAPILVTHKNVVDSIGYSATYTHSSYGLGFTVENVAAEHFKEQLVLVRARGAAKQREIEKLVFGTFSGPFAPSTASQAQSRRPSRTRSTR